MAFYVASLAQELQLEWLILPVLYCMCSCPAGDIADGYIWCDNIGKKQGDTDKGEEESERKDKGKKKIKVDKEDAVRTTVLMREGCTDGIHCYGRRARWRWDTRWCVVWLYCCLLGQPRWPGHPRMFGVSNIEIFWYNYRPF
jgi:hypothetical protein